MGVYIVLIALGILLVYDCVTVLRKQRQTISRMVWDKSKVWPWLPFLVGFGMGHLFWPN